MHDSRINELLSILLLTGVALAALVVLFGGTLYLTRHQVPNTNYHMFQGEPEPLRSIPGIVREASAFRGTGLIQLGLLILIATPVARVAFSLTVFMCQRDWVYAAVTLFVFVLLLYSLFGGQA